MANESPTVILGELRNAATAWHEALYKVLQLRDRFNAFGGTPGFEGAGKLFAADGSGQAIPYADFLGVYNALGDLETNHASSWNAMVAQLARTRG